MPSSQLGEAMLGDLMLGLSTDPPPQPARNVPLLERVPDLERRLGRVTNVLSAFFNSLALEGQIILTGPSAYELVFAGSGFKMTPGPEPDATPYYGQMWVDADGTLHYLAPGGIDYELAPATFGLDALFVHIAGTETITGAKTFSETVTLSKATGNTLIVDTTTLVVDATNNRVGIGTASPSRALHVVSAAPFRFGTATDYLEFIQQNTNLWAWLGSPGNYVMAWDTANARMRVGASNGPPQVTLEVISVNYAQPSTFGLISTVSDGTERLRATWVGTWTDSTDATRKARIVGNVYDTAAREWIRGEASGSAAMIGFLGTAAAVQQTGDIGTALATFGLMDATQTLAASKLTGQVALANGGTGANLSDPGANVLMGWDDTDNAVCFITLGTGLSYDHSTHTLSSTGGSGTPGGNDTYVQFNDSSSFGGDAGFTYNKTTDTATLAGDLKCDRVGMEDTDSSHYLYLEPGSDLTADRVLTITTGDAARTLTLSANLTVTATADVSGTLVAASGKTFTCSNTLTFTGTDSSSVAFGGGGTVAYTADKLSVFAATTSAELAGVISDETGSGALVFATSPSLTTPTLGVASATTINKVTITAPATGSTLTIDDGFTLHATGNVTALSGSHTGSSSGTNTGDASFDALSNLVNAINSLSNPSAANLSANTWNVIAATAACDAKLPAPAAGKVCGVRITNGSTNLFTLNPNASEKIHPGNLSSRIMWAGESAILVSDGTDWYKVAGLTRPMVCRLSAASSQNLTNNAFTAITLGTTDLDNTGLMAATANTITIKRAGEYVLGLYGGATHISSNDPVIHSFYKSGSEWRRVFRGPADFTGTGGGACVIEETMAASDALTMDTYVGSASGGTTATENATGNVYKMWAVESSSW